MSDTSHKPTFLGDLGRGIWVILRGVLVVAVVLAIFAFLGWMLPNAPVEWASAGDPKNLVGTIGYHAVHGMVWVFYLFLAVLLIRWLRRVGEWDREKQESRRIRREAEAQSRESEGDADQAERTSSVGQ